jgi:hypothetical protein
MPAYRPALSKRHPVKESSEGGRAHSELNRPRSSVLLSPQAVAGARGEPQLPPISGKNCGA